MARHIGFPWTSAMSRAASALVAVLVACATPSLTVPAHASQRWLVDPARTRIDFGIDAIGWPRTEGRFRQFEGRLSLDFEHPSRSRVEFSVAADSLDVGSPALAGFIRGAGFLDTARHPRISFVSTHVEKVDAHTVRVSGDLSLLDVTRPVTIDVAVTRDPGDRKLGFRATWSIMRSWFGMSTGLPLIADKVDLEVATEASAGEGL